MTRKKEAESRHYPNNNAKKLPTKQEIRKKTKASKYQVPIICLVQNVDKARSKNVLELYLTLFELQFLFHTNSNMFSPKKLTSKREAQPSEVRPRKKKEEIRNSTKK